MLKRKSQVHRDKVLTVTQPDTEAPGLDSSRGRALQHTGPTPVPLPQPGSARHSSAPLAEHEGLEASVALIILG